jgi:hypothetical protein
VDTKDVRSLHACYEAGQVVSNCIMAQHELQARPTDRPTADAVRTSCRMLAAAAAAGSGEVAAELAAPPLPRPAAERVDMSALVPDSSRLSRGTPGEGTAAAALTCGSMTPKDRDVPAGDDTC